MKYVRKRRVYVRWFLSYLLLLLPPIAIGIMIYSHTLKTNSEQAEKLNHSLMKVITNEFDHQVDSVLQSLNRLALDSSIQQLSNARGQFTPDDQYNLYALYNNLKSSSFSEEYVNEVFVYFGSNGMVVSTQGNMQYDLYYSICGQNDQYTVAEMKDYLSVHHFRDVLPLTNGEKKYLLFTMNCIQTDLGETSAVIGMRIDVSNLEALFAAAKWDDRIQLGILDGDSRLIHVTDENFRNVTNYEQLQDQSLFEIGIGDEAYLGMMMPAKKLDWNYLLFVPQSLYRENAQQIQRVCVVGLFASIVIGLFLSYYLCKVNYNPLQDLMDMFKKQGRVDEVDENEFQWLNRQSRKFFSEYNTNRRMLSNNQRQLKWYTLLKLLENPYDDAEMEADFRKLKLPSDAPFYVVLIVSVDSIGDAGNESDDYMKENALHKFIVSNIFEEMVGEYYLAEVTDLGHQVAAIISLPEQEESKERLKQILEDVQQLTADKFGFSITVFMGGINPGPEGIHESCLQAREGREYAGLLDTDMVIYDEVRNIQKKYTYTIDTEQKIINAIKAGNSQLAYDTVLQVLNQNGAAPISVDMRRCLIFDMMGTLLKGAENGGYYTFAEDFHFGREFASHSPDEVREQFGRLIEGLCTKIRELQEDTKEDKRMSRKIEAFIAENYGDPDLNISILGQHFHMTPAYLSGVYKKQTGNSLLDYINNTRIGHAEELLKQGRSVVDVAELVGFRDSGAFIRVFKRKRGVTPGQLKKLLEHG